MGTATLRTLTRAEVQGEIERLVASLGMTLAQARELEFTGTLTPDQYEALARIRDLEWLAEEE